MSKSTNLNHQKKMGNVDSYVSKLHYAVKTEESVDYKQAEPLREDRGDLSLNLCDGKLTVGLKEGIYPDIASARTRVDLFLRAWEIDVALRLGRGELSFAYQEAEIIDNSPESEEGHRTAYLEPVSLRAIASFSAEVDVSRGHYPSPPSSFSINPDIETLWHRYTGYLNGNEPLPAMGYFCLTLIEFRAGGGSKNKRDKARRKYKISRPVLNKLSELTTKRGDRLNARKYDVDAPLSPSESRWIEATIKSIIRQLGIIEAGQQPSQLTMADLPDLS